MTERLKASTVCFHYNLDGKRYRASCLEPASFRCLTHLHQYQRTPIRHVGPGERGKLRLHGQLIVKLNGILGVSAEELLGLTEAPSTGALRNRRLPRRDQPALLRTIDRFLDSFRTS